MGVYDQAARYAYRAEPEGVTRRLLRQVTARLVLRELVDTRTTPLPGERDRTCDVVAALDDVDHPDLPWLLVAEFQAQHDADKLDVTLVYVARLRADFRHGPEQRGKYLVAVALVYLRGRARESVLDMTLPGTGGAGTRHETLVWNVADDEAAAVLAGVASGEFGWGLLFWIPLMQGGAEAGIIQEWLRLAQQVSSARLRADLGRVVLVFAELAGNAPVWRKALEDWDMSESQLVMEWTEEARKEGIKEGIKEGDLQARRDAVLLVLQTRFPAQAPAAVVAAINKQKDLAILNQWLQLVATALHMEDIQAVIAPVSPSCNGPG